MGRPATLAIRITADASRAQRGAAQAQRAFSGLTRTIGRMAATAGALALGGGIADFARKAVTAASEVEQNFGALDAVFKGNSAQMKRWAEGAAQSAGLSKRQYSGMAVVLGASLKNQGVALKDVGSLTNDLIHKGADLASMFGGTTQEAVEALTAAFRGEADPAERYGLNLSKTAVNAYKAAHASEKLTDTQARLRLITEQSKDATGNFAKEANTLEGQQQRLAAQWDNMAASLGAKVLPALTALASWTNGTVLPAVASLAQGIGAAVPVVVEFAQGVARTVQDFAPLIVAVGAVVAILAGPYLAALITTNVQGLIWVARMTAQTIAARAVTIATTAQAAAQRVLNLVMNQNPIARVISLLILIAGAIYTAYQRSETFRNICNKVWDIVRRVGSLLAGAFKAAWNGVRSAIGWVVDKVKTAITWLARIKVPSPLDALRAAFVRIRDAAGWVVDKVKQVIDWVKRIPGGGILGKALNKFSAAPAAAPEAAAASAYGLYSARNGGTDLARAARAIVPATTVYITIDGQQLQGRISRTVDGALNADGARYAARGWA